MGGSGKCFLGGKYMKNFEYVAKKEFGPVKNELMELIYLVQDEVRDYFTFRFDFIGSASRNMITREVNGNIGYDFDINIRVNDPDEKYNANELRQILMNGFNKFSNRFKYDSAEDHSRVFTIKVKDKQNSRIVHSCDFAIVEDLEDGRQIYVRFNKSNNSCSWELQPEGYYQIGKKIKIIKEYRLWQEVRDVYLYKKCSNTDSRKKSRALFAETIKEVYERNFQ